MTDEFLSSKDWSVRIVLLLESIDDTCQILIETQTTWRKFKKFGSTELFLVLQKFKTEMEINIDLQPTS